MGDRVEGGEVPVRGEFQDVPVRGEFQDARAPPPRPSRASSVPEGTVARTTRATSHRW
ncbi:hypothetical protein [Streptomyces sp. NPDC091259]|uniref:hypothetical protein n=1 Tax=Streptomyces sp. NPDC091259 TaxID=3365976 RepID=UPI00381A89B8